MTDELAYKHPSSFLGRIILRSLLYVISQINLLDNDTPSPLCHRLLPFCGHISTYTLPYGCFLGSSPEEMTHAEILASGLLVGTPDETDTYTPKDWQRSPLGSEGAIGSGRKRFA